MTKCDGLDLLDSLAEATYKIGDIAFVKEEAEKGKTIPVMITGVDYDVNAASDGQGQSIKRKTGSSNISSRSPQSF